MPKRSYLNLHSNNSNNLIYLFIHLFIYSFIQKYRLCEKGLKTNNTKIYAIYL